MSLDADVTRRLKELLEKPHPYDCCYGANWLLWSLDPDGLTEAERLAAEWGKPLHDDWITWQRELRQEWPDPQVALDSLEPCRNLAHIGAFLYEEGQSATYALLHFAKWANADPAFILEVMEDVWEKTEAAGDQGYAELLFKSGSSPCSGGYPVPQNRRCFVVVSLARYTEYAPATCRRYFMEGLHSSSGGYYNYRRWGRDWNQKDSGSFAFFGITPEARQEVQKRVSDLSHRIYEGGWS